MINLCSVQSGSVYRQLPEPLSGSLFYACEVSPTLIFVMTWADSLQWQPKTAADKQRPPRMIPSWDGEALQRSVQAAAATFPIFCGSFSKCQLRWGLRGLINDLLMGKWRSWGGNVPFPQGHSQVLIKIISRYDCKINLFPFNFNILYNCCKNDIVMWDFRPCDRTNSCQTLVRGVLMFSEGTER